MDIINILALLIIYIPRTVAIVGFIQLAMYFNHWWIGLFSLLFIGDVKMTSNKNEDNKNG